MPIEDTQSLSVPDVAIESSRDARGIALAAMDEWPRITRFPPGLSLRQVWADPLSRARRLLASDQDILVSAVKDGDLVVARLFLDASMVRERLDMSGTSADKVAFAAIEDWVKHETVRNEA